MPPMSFTLVSKTSLMTGVMTVDGGAVELDNLAQTCTESCYDSPPPKLSMYYHLLDLMIF